MEKKIRLVIGDDDLFLVESFNSLLRDHGEIEVIGTATEYHDLAMTTHKQLPDVAIVGMDLLLWQMAANRARLFRSLSQGLE
jgi:DNA-binding NarL/FixJ family response regulator